MGILTTTYGVGELSALNGVMGSRAHRLPVLHLVGMPSQRIQRLGLLTHHNLSDTVYDRFQTLSGRGLLHQCQPDAIWPLSWAMTPICIDEMERMIREALRQSLPAYVVISEVNGDMPVVGTPVKGKPLSALKRQGSVAKELDAAVTNLLARIAAAKNPVVIVTHLVARYGVADHATAFIEKPNLPFVMMPNDKGTPDESLPQYMGHDGGIWSSLPEVCKVVEAADLIVDIGGLLTHEINTGM